METRKDIFDIFAHDENYQYIMKRLLEASMEESFNSVIISEAGPGYPIVLKNHLIINLQPVTTGRKNKGECNGNEKRYF